MSDPKQPSSRRRAATRATKARKTETGEPYTEARRAATKTGKVDDVAGVVMPAPIALMIARQFNAGWRHFGVAKRLAEDNGAPIGDGLLGRPDSGPLAAAAKTVSHTMFEIRSWAERTAVASGAVTTVPGFFNQSAEQKKAEQALYPRDDLWCHQAGKTMPQPGEHPDAPDTADRDVRYTLPGPVPEYGLTYAAQGRTVHRAREVVAGTPAATVWDAVNGLHGYLMRWMCRAGDSPADLAAAADGLIEVATALADCANTVLAEAERRQADGSMTGLSVQRLAAARKLVDETDAGRDVTRAVRAALAGGRPALPDTAPGSRIGYLATRMDGTTVGALRDELGGERFLQRQRGKTRPEEWGRHDGLLRMIRWCQAGGRDTYDRAAHQVDDPGVF